MSGNKKARIDEPNTDQGRQDVVEDDEDEVATAEGDSDDEGSYGVEDDLDDSVSESSEDSQELESLQLLSKQMQAVKETNQQLKQALVALNKAKDDNSNEQLVASLLAKRKAGGGARGEDSARNDSTAQGKPLIIPVAPEGRRC